MRAFALCHHTMLAAVASLLAVASALAQSPTPGEKRDRPAGAGAVKEAALDDPRVKRCLFLAFRRQDPKLDVMTTHVERAAMVFDIPGLHDGVAACRAAFAAFPAEPKVIIAHYNAVEAMSLLLFGLQNFPPTDAQAVARAHVLALQKTDNLSTKLTGFFLGSAYEYGIGVTANAAQAARWYRQSADAGDPIAKRELDRLLAEASARR